MSGEKRIGKLHERGVLVCGRRRCFVINGGALDSNENMRERETRARSREGEWDGEKSCETRKIKSQYNRKTGSLGRAPFPFFAPGFEVRGPSKRETIVEGLGEGYL